MIKISDLRNRDVVNVVDGKRLGVICDLDLDLEQGRICALIVPGGSKFFSFFSGGQDYVIPWENIIKIGVDTILVELAVPSYRSR
ncbi:YlmC/YmxH family sporulation protein [Dethiobacter alkaliphilus]|uniref:YlmC/YmxH family sporulation protein n=1 Tax=Dethiobacter alkaliphilus TaxID=427926 RepID=UPI00222760E8|nr:YlmC/YmxH family sporulation protein [Dethiobacter alkaliphilus]MCW3491219.1 YlmC/YmxH family sporulation protein [Dethiobacter alkaliphilus]